MWLREEFGSRAFFPDSTNATFDLPPDSGLSSYSLIVEGSEVQSPSTSAGNVHVATPGSAPRPNLLSGPSGKKLQTMNVKVVKATIKRLPGGRCEFCHLGQIFVDVIESTANVHYIQSAVQKRWGAEHVPGHCRWS